MKNSKSSFPLSFWQCFTNLVLSILLLSSSLATGQAPDPLSFGPSVATPAVTPSALAVDPSPLTIAVNVKISYPEGMPVIPGSVYLLQAQEGGPPTVLAQLNDEGVNGDLTAGDSIFGGTAQVNVSQTGLILLQAEAMFSGNPYPILSSAGTIEVFPSDVPFQFQKPNMSYSNICHDASGNEGLCDTVLMLFQPGTIFSYVNSAAASVEATVAGLVNFPAINIWQLKTQCTTDDCLQNAVRELNQDAVSGDYPGLFGAEPDLLDSGDAGEQTKAPNDPYYSLQWGAPRVALPLAWAITTGSFPNGGGRALTAIVDTGVDNTHPDLNNAVRLGSNWINDTGGANRDECGHGTAVAGVMGASGNNGIGISGASWTTRLLAIKVREPEGAPPCAGRGTIAAANRGLREAVDKGASIINYSASGAYSEARAAAVDYINSADRLLVASAGNSNSNVQVYPAGFGVKACFPPPAGTRCYTTVNLSVGATTATDARAGFSNYGGWVRLYAPGECIISTVRAGDPLVMAGDKCLPAGAMVPAAAARLNYFDGTSFAAPLVSGTASLMHAANSALSAGSIRVRLTSLSENIGRDPAGNIMHRMNAFRAVRCAATGLCQ
jgi:hypothetical protein